MALIGVAGLVARRRR
ncbi:MAG: hypothetical protein ACO3RV_07570 [Luteolibacter sp.]